MTERKNKKGHRVEIRVDLGDLEPADLLAQLWVDDGTSSRALAATLVDRAGARARYEARVEAGVLTADVDLAARVLPAPLHTDGEPLAGLIAWSS